MTTHHWSETLVAPILLIASFLLSPLPRLILQRLSTDGSKKGHEIGKNFSKDGQGSDKTVSSFVVPAQIHHARMLPRESQHSFKYPSLYLAFELQALEGRQCDCLPAFKWNGHHSFGKGEKAFGSNNSFALTKLDPKDFGRKTFVDAQSSNAAKIIDGSILLKLAYELRFRGYLSIGPQDLNDDDLMSTSFPWDREIGQIWAIAMPSVFGLAGFNPLTVYYAHRPGPTRQLWLAILEVHNTFNERHIYICEVDKGEDTKIGIRKGYDHSWTFPRDFHVSPFNDRLGYYQLFLRKMWKDSSPEEEEDNDDVPSIDIRLLLLVPPEDEDAQHDKGKSLQKKLLATLTSSDAISATQKPFRKARPMTASTVLSMLLLQPLDLFLPVTRIMWEAAKLHWKKRLPVHIRPEPRGEAKKWNFDDDHQESFDSIGWPKVHNPTEHKDLNEDAAKIRQQASGDIYWNDESFIERICRKQIERYLCFQTRNTKISPIYFKHRNAEVRDIKIDHGKIHKIDKHESISEGLTFYTMSFTLFIDLCLFVPQQALLFGSKVEQGWGVNAIEKFHNVFTNDQPFKLTRTVRIARYLRSSYLQWAIRENESERVDHQIEQELLFQSTQTHFLDRVDYTWSLLLALTIHIYSLKIMAFASRLLNVRFVRTPWAQIGEGIALLKHERAQKSHQYNDTQISPITQ